MSEPGDPPFQPALSSARPKWRGSRRCAPDSRPVRIAGVTLQKLMRLAERASTPDRKVDPLEVAARLLEEAVAAAEV